MHGRLHWLDIRLWLSSFGIRSKVRRVLVRRRVFRVRGNHALLLQVLFFLARKILRWLLLCFPWLLDRCWLLRSGAGICRHRGCRCWKLNMGRWVHFKGSLHERVSGIVALSILGVQLQWPTHLGKRDSATPRLYKRNWKVVQANRLHSTQMAQQWI